MWAVESNSIAFSQPRQNADDAGWRRQKGAFANAGWHQQQFKWLLIIVFQNDPSHFEKGERHGVGCVVIYHVISLVSRGDASGSY